MSKIKEKKFFEMHYEESSFDQPTYNFINKILGKTKSTILELGCGSGSWTKELAKKENFVIGVDFSLNSIRELRNKKGDFNIETVVADIDYLPFKNNFADQVFFGCVLHHSIDVFQTMKEAKRCLQNNGIMVMIEPNGSNFLRIFTHQLGIIINRVLKKRITSYQEKPLNVHEVCARIRTVWLVLFVVILFRNMIPLLQNGPNHNLTVYLHANFSNFLLVDFFMKFKP